MVNHSGNNDDFKRMQKLGFKFSDRGDFSDQPDSGGAIGGERGRQEYGIDPTTGEGTSDLVAKGLDGFSVQDATDIEEIELVTEPAPGVIDASDFPGVSEWSEESALEPESKVEELEMLDDNARSRRNGGRAKGPKGSGIVRRLPIRTGGGSR